MTLLILMSGVALWVGLTILLAEVPWIARRPLRERLALYAIGPTRSAGRAGVLSVESFRDVLGPLARLVGGHVGRVLGLHDDLDRRLRRIQSTLDPTAFRVRQLGWSLAGFAAGVTLAVALRAPAAAGVVFAIAGVLGAFAVLEQRLTVASVRRQDVIRRELPVVAEQIGMLLASGWSLGGALERIARRGAGETADDLRRVLARVRQGADEQTALAEWADLADVDAVTRLVAVLSLERHAADLGRLITTEARGMRRDLHRDLLTRIERRGQQVWIPVTVATLLPGAIFIAVPFTAALDAFLSA